jgi:hypothetical protein
LIDDAWALQMFLIAWVVFVGSLGRELSGRRSCGALRLDPEVRDALGSSRNDSCVGQRAGLPLDVGTLVEKGVDRCGRRQQSLLTPGYDRLGFRQGLALRCVGQAVSNTLK